MANEEKISSTGVFVDGKTGEVVYEAPEEGVQLVAPGGVVDANAEQDIQLAKDAAAGVSNVGTLGTHGTVEAASTEPAEQAADTSRPAPRKPAK